jgi:polyphosphate kinase 2 (PPK2 family)
VRVHEIVPEKVWRGRYDHIRNFESLLAGSGTIVLKVWLHISKEEQEARLIERENDPEAAWKLAVGDWKEREYWDKYQEAYSEAIGECGAESAPWLVVPADKKWWRNYVVTSALVEILAGYEEGWRDRLDSIGADAKAELAAFRAGS